MSKLLKDLLYTTLECYKRGTKQPALINLARSGEEFRRNLETIIHTHLPMKEYLLLRKYSEAQRQGLLAARRGDLAAADQLFAEANVLLDLEKPSLECSLLCKSFQGAAEAYLDYRRSDFDKAIARIYEVLAIDLVLEEKYGYAILHLHRIQLLHNLMRVEARRAHLEEAINLGYQLLDYLEGKSEALPIFEAWDSMRVTSLPLQLVEGMFAQITEEIAVILTGKERWIARDLFTGALHHTQVEVADNCYLHPRCHLWFRAKQAFVDNDLTTFLELASQFLIDGRGEIGLLWYRLVLDVAILCNELDLPEADLLIGEIASDAPTWSDTTHGMRNEI